MDFTRSNLFALLNKFEETFKDADFSHGETNFYPVVKIQYAYQLYLLYIKGMPASLGRTAIKPVQIKFSKRLYCKLKVAACYLKNGIIRKNTAQVLVTGFKEHETDKLLSGTGELSNPFMAPFEKIFKEAGISYSSFNIDDIGSTSQLKKVFEVYPRMEALAVSDISHNRILVDNLSGVETFSAENGITLTGLADFIFNSIVQNEVHYQLLKIYLKGSGYKKVLYYCYYNNQVMALNRAARDLGIETIEYQHSLQPDDHFAYSEWKYNIHNADHHFPSLFWVWNEADKIRIENNFKLLNVKSKAITGGNVYLGLLHERFHHTGKKENGILVVLQGAWIPEFIERSVANNPGYRWYFRLHPRYPVDKERAEHLKATYPDRVETEEANSLSLYELFGKVKFAITAFSGTAVEAQAFGIQNIIFGEAGYQAYQSYIENDAFLFVNDEHELNALLQKEKQVFKSYNNMLIDIDNIRSNVINCFSNN